MPSAQPFLSDRLARAVTSAQASLLAFRSSEGFWAGELSSSALSTATAVTALASIRRHSPGDTRYSGAIESGLRWLSQHQNADGGWGDTPLSLSNISTTTLVWAAFGAGGEGGGVHRVAEQRAEAWLRDRTGGLEPDRLALAIIARYGKDRTFSVPILTACALSGRFGTGAEAWHRVIPLPFELAALPHQLFAALRLPVVSYALPALIAIGQVRHHFSPPRNPAVRLLRQVSRRRTLEVLQAIQPANGGFLEATPLTSFVTMSLAGLGQPEHEVARRGVSFLTASQRADGSWPIDTNLATWVTTLSLNALGSRAMASRPAEERVELCRWLLQQQYRVEHPYTHAAPGGWAWTDLPGGVPDADDTAGALLALRTLGPVSSPSLAAGEAGVRWLLGIQNRDGGIPTFCRGWGALPFDRSSADITAHAVRAWLAWRDDLPECWGDPIDKGIRRALRFLAGQQRSDGSWLPLWFGNQYAPDDENPVYGTARVMAALAEASARPSAARGIDPACLARAVTWMTRVQTIDGGWGGAEGVESSVEETALAVEALALAVRAGSSSARDTARSALARGVLWLVGAVESGRWLQPSPIGFYFAKLWYYEKLYPAIFTAAALSQADALSRSGYFKTG